MNNIAVCYISDKSFQKLYSQANKTTVDVIYVFHKYNIWIKVSSLVDVKTQVGII